MATFGQLIGGSHLPILLGSSAAKLAIGFVIRPAEKNSLNAKRSRSDRFIGLESHLGNAAGVLEFDESKSKIMPPAARCGFEGGGCGLFRESDSAARDRRWS